MKLLIGISVAAVVAGFFLPWAQADLRQPGVVQKLNKESQNHGATKIVSEGIGKLFGGIKQSTQKVSNKLPGVKISTKVSGFQIPRMVNQKGAQVAVAILEILIGKQQHLGLKSYAVYLLPGLALLLGGLLLLSPGKPAINLGVAAVSSAITIGGSWKFLTLDASAILLAVTIGFGLWLSLLGFAGLATAAILKQRNQTTT